MGSCIIRFLSSGQLAESDRPDLGALDFDRLTAAPRPRSAEVTVHPSNCVAVHPLHVTVYPLHATVHPVTIGGGSSVGSQQFGGSRPNFGEAVANSVDGGVGGFLVGNVKVRQSTL